MIFLIFWLTKVVYAGIWTGDFLKISPAPIPQSLSQAYTSQVGPDSVLYNPAGMGLLTYSAFSASHNKYIENILHDFATITINTSYGNLSGFYSIMRSDNIQAYDEYENPKGYISASYSLYGFTYSKGFPYFEYARKKIDPMLITPSWTRLKPVKVYIPKVYRLSFGITYKKFEEKLASEKRGIDLLDAGLLLVLPGHFQSGISFQNISTKKLSFYQQKEKIPITFRFGISKDFPTIKDIMNFIFMADYVTIEGKGKYINGGMEVDIAKSFQARFGYTTDKNTEFSRFVFGAGINFDRFLSGEGFIKGLRLDYAYTSHNYFGLTHRFGFQIIW